MKANDLTADERAALDSGIEQWEALRSKMREAAALRQRIAEDAARIRERLGLDFYREAGSALGVNVDRVMRYFEASEAAEREASARIRDSLVTELDAMPQRDDNGRGGDGNGGGGGGGGGTTPQFNSVSLNLVRGTTVPADPQIPPGPCQPVQATASGLGRGLCGTQTVTSTTELQFFFAFTPPAGNQYFSSPWFSMRGFYLTRAFADTWTAREAGVLGSLRLWHFQDNAFVDLLPPEPISVNTFFARGGSSVDEAETFDTPLRQSSGTGFYHRQLSGGSPVVIIAQFFLSATARGGGAEAELNMSDGTGRFCCPQLDVSWTTFG